jgi:PAS domain S-box-containing protein
MVWQSLLVSAITIVVLSGVSYAVTRSVTTEQRLFERLSSLATDRKNTIEQVVFDTRQRTTLLAKTLERGSPENITKEKLQSILVTLDQSQVRAIGAAIFDDEQKFLFGVGDKVPGYFWSFNGTLLLPYIDAKKGWVSVTAYAPLHAADGTRSGTIAVQYDVAPLVSQVFSDLSESVGQTAEITLAKEQGGEIVVIHHSLKNQKLLSFRLGSLDDEFIAKSPIAMAVQGQEGVTQTQDDRGKKVLVAYRFLPSLGWGLTVQIESVEAFAGVTALGFTLLSISMIVLALAGTVGFVFARRLTEPLLHLVVKIQVLRPGHWLFHRSVKTGDEVELLDQVIADLATRLQSSYEKLEGKVEEKTVELAKQVTLDRAILESIEYGVIATDAKGVITDSNSAASRLLGYRHEEFYGKPAQEMLRLQHQKGQFTAENHPVSVCLHDHSIFRAPPSMHLCIPCKDTRLLPVMLMVTPLLKDGELLGTIVIFLDVTEERQTDYMKSEFISLASHQLRTPLSSLRWYLELITSDEKATFSDDQKSYLSEIQKASSEMAHLLDTLLRVARLDDGGMLIERKQVDIVDVLGRIFDEVKQSNKNEKITFRSALPKGPIMVSTDTVLFPIVMQNLITNAMKYSPDGGEIAMELEQQNDKILVRVSDHGLGISAEEQARVFQKFFRAKNSRHMLTSGTGLGLYLSKRIMESLGGTLAFQSVEGQGTTFTATLVQEGK